MVKIREFEFNLREFASSLGDFGPLNPFILGYIRILSMDPAGILLAMGLANIALFQSLIAREADCDTQ